ncbi:MAG: hypothetical protein EOO46_16050 [Flavobacterium sp.]|nr:MAG: hypothetical protein EOO46_16050 [Flavobacterium sp.]
MLITKNTYGVTSVFSNKKTYSTLQIGEARGSSLDRTQEDKDKDFLANLIRRPLFPEEKEKRERKPRVMSRRTKTKIRKKVIAFSRLHKKLSFLTLTFCNQVEEQKAVKVLHKFLDNAAKRSKDFQYIWVAEKQTENKVFENNIHFHLITNKYWKIDKWWKYWLELQAKFGIVPRETSFNPSSAFDVKPISGNNIKAIANYLTHYVTKNESEFMCQIWNCSKKISRLYTEFYGDIGFVKKLEKLEALELLGGERKVYVNDFAATHLIPLNKITLGLYGSLDEKNKQVWNMKESKGGSHV